LLWTPFYFWFLLFYTRRLALLILFFFSNSIWFVLVHTLSINAFLHITRRVVIAQFFFFLLVLTTRGRFLLFLTHFQYPLDA